ncbi:MAG: APC family permease [Gammaproteobacteria bacterium]|nr:APC family permease [Gammaproteobacteria bacterium]
MKADIETGDEPLPRQFSVLALWLLVINGIIGAGIFGVPARAAELLGAYSPIAFVLCGLLMAPVLLCFGEVSSYFRGTGGPILYARAAFGPVVGFQTGWTFYMARMMAFAANINLLVNTLGYFIPGVDSGASRLFILFLICASLVWVNVIGARQAMQSLGILTLLKMLPIAVLIGVGMWQIPAEFLPASHVLIPDGQQWGAALIILVYAFVGFESGLVPAAEARDPQRDMPRALLWALIIATLLYGLIQSLAVAVLPDLASSKRPLVDMAAVLMGPAGAALVMAGVVASVGGNVAGAMLSTPRASYMLAREGYLPHWFAGVHPVYNTPGHSVIFFGVAAFVLAAYGSFVWLASMSVLSRLLIYLLCIGAIPRLRRKFGADEARFHLPGGYLIPILGAAVCIWLLSQVSLDAVLSTALFLALGSVLYLFARRERNRG